VVIDYVGFENCDTTGGHYTIFLYDNGGPLITSFDSIAKAGCGWDYNAAALDWQYDSNGMHSLTFYVGQLPSAPIDGSDGVRGINVRWHRKLSPAPAVATFPDVPTNDFGFQYVEALVASGITGGCAPPNYCPNDFVTRRQMAIFLAKALGLHWPE
jgi:S-layer homology domain